MNPDTPNPAPAASSSGNPYLFALELATLVSLTVLVAMRIVDAGYLLMFLGMTGGAMLGARAQGRNGAPPAAGSSSLMLLALGVSTLFAGGGAMLKRGAAALGLVLVVAGVAGCTPSMQRGILRAMPFVLEQLADVARTVCVPGDTLDSCARKCGEELERRADGP